MRIVSWNVENLVRWLAARDEFTAHVKALGDPDVLCLQEIRIRPSDAEDIAAMRALLPGYQCYFALANDPRNVKFRGGRAHGVATYVKGTAIAATPAWDREGRVVVTALGGLAIVNLYAVNGTSRPYVDPDTGAPRGDRHEHKRRFQTQLFDLAAELRAAGDVVLAGDWNVSRSAADVTPRLRTEEPHATARAQLDDRLAADRWVDIFRELHPDARQYTWFGRTRTGALDAARVDYIVVGAELLPRVRAAEILDDRRLRPHSDHAPLRLDLAPAT
jgi:exodeoxyribonuclease III